MYSKLTISFSSNVEKNAFEKWLIEFVMVCRINWYHSHTFIQSVLLNVILHEFHFSVKSNKKTTKFKLFNKHGFYL